MELLGIRSLGIYHALLNPAGGPLPPLLIRDDKSLLYHRVRRPAKQPRSHRRPICRPDCSQFREPQLGGEADIFERERTTWAQWIVFRNVLAARIIMCAHLATHQRLVPLGQRHLIGSSVFFPDFLPRGVEGIGRFPTLSSQPGLHLPQRRIVGRTYASRAFALFRHWWLSVPGYAPSWVS